MAFTTAIAATVLLYTWVLAPVTPRWTASAAAALVVALAIAHAARTRDWGVRWNALAPATRLTALFTAIAAAGVLLAGWSRGTLGARTLDARDAAALVPWALGQQFALQTVILSDTRRSLTRHRALAIVIAAALFAALHLPNPFLAAATFAAACAWCAIYDRAPNVVPLTLSHALLTAVVLYALDDAVTGRLRVGIAYLQR